MSREQRKLDHIKYALKLGDGPLTNGLENVHFVHNCLPELNPQDIVLSSQFGGIFFLSPFLINAVTGGADAVTEINRRLARAAKKAGAAIAVGSQYGSVKNKTNYQSYEVVREEYPDGIVFANTSALATPEEALEAVRMLDADALQIHLNPAQELIMPEGDRDFKGLFANMQRILDKCPVPVIVKETGCGMAKKEAQDLLDVGVTLLDIGGAGGTNFPAIEHQRYPEGNEELSEWGIPTVLSLLSVVQTVGWGNGVIASGGIRSALDVVKAQVLGASAVAMAGNLLQKIQQEGTEETIHFLQRLLNKVLDFYTLLGCRTFRDLHEARYYLTGETAQAVSWLRKYDQND